MQKIIKFSTYLALKNSGNLDSDFDGLTDWEELEIGTNPFDADTDGDGVKDGVQFKTQKNALELIMLKDFFVPHEGNGFKPFALKPGRLLFHASAALLVKTLMIGFIVAMPIEAWLAPDILTGQQQKIIALTNQLRQAENLESLVENSVLNQAAEAKVADMLADDYFAHVSPSGKGLAGWLKQVGYNYAVAGENLAMGFVSADEVIEAWRKSPTHYANLVDNEYSQIGVAMAAGNLDGEKTTVIAQYFGQERLPVQVSPMPLAVSAKPDLADTQIKLSVLERPVPDKKLIRAEAILANGTVEADLKVGEKIIKLEQTGQPNQWAGSAIISESSNVSQASVPATLITVDQVYGQRQADVSASILTVKSNFLSDYNYLKRHSLASSLWSFVSGYYVFLLVLSIAALLLNVLIEVRRQHPHLIVSTMSLIGLLSILIII